MADETGEVELTLEGGGARVTVSGVEYGLRVAFEIWAEMHKVVHEANMEEIRTTGARPGPASAGFAMEQSAERRNGLLPGGTGALPV